MSQLVQLGRPDNEAKHLTDLFQWPVGSLSILPSYHMAVCCFSVLILSFHKTGLFQWPMWSVPVLIPSSHTQFKC